MGMLSMNPDCDGGVRSNLALQIAENEEWAEHPVNLPEKEMEPEEIKPVKKMKFGPFQLDMSYPRTFPGIIRIAQIVIMLIAFVCLIASQWPDQGSFTFYCIFLIFGVFISGYLFFSIIADLRGDAFCGVSWILLELIYFILFGGIIFLGSCLAASNAQGMAGLTVSAILGFVATLTYIYYIWNTWKVRKEHRRKLLEELEKEVENENEDEENSIAKRPITPASIQKNDFELERETASEHNSRRPSLKLGRQSNSFPSHLKDQFYENQDSPVKNQRRRHYSASDKDSAYSEGTITPTRGKVIPPKMRRTASAHDMDQEYDNVLHKQPLTHLTHRPYGGRADHDARRANSAHKRGRTGYGFPRELSTHSFTNMGYNRDGSRFNDDDFNKSLKRRKSMPDWLRAALGTDVRPGDNILDDESEVALPSMKRISTLNAISPKEFPLLAHSDQESINYPSISQNGPGRQFYTMPPKQHGEFPEMMEFRQQHHHHRHRRNKRRRGHHPHNGKRPFHSHHHRHQHHQHKMHQQKHHGHNREGGRRPINDAHEDYLRRMVENDELVTKDGFAGKPLRGFQSHHGKPIETAGQRRVLPEQPISIQFPERSRWDDDMGHPDIQNPMMEKYLADAQKMRA